MKINTPRTCPLCASPDIVVAYTRGIFRVYRCLGCSNGFTHPVPQDLSAYYPKSYWHVGGIWGWIKDTVFSLCQYRRVRWVTRVLPTGYDIVDVGCGNALYARQMDRGYRVTSIDAYAASRDIITADFLTWKASQTYDAIVFWESLEHVTDVSRYIKKASTLLKQHGTIWVEYPRWQSWEAKIFGKHWFHLDLPRHLTHFTDYGIRSFFEKNGFSVVSQRGVLAMEYAPWGLAASVSSHNLIVTCMLAVFAIPIEIMLFFIGQSPIGLLVVQKK